MEAPPVAIKAMRTALERSSLQMEAVCGPAGKDPFLFFLSIDRSDFRLSVKRTSCCEASCEGAFVFAALLFMSPAARQELNVAAVYHESSRKTRLNIQQTCHAVSVSSLFLFLHSSLHLSPQQWLMGAAQSDPVGQIHFRTLTS